MNSQKSGAKGEVCTHTPTPPKPAAELWGFCPQAPHGFGELLQTPAPFSGCRLPYLTRPVAKALFVFNSRKPPVVKKK